MECAVKPIHHEILPDQEDRRLRPQGQLGERAVAIFVEFDESVRVRDAEQDRGTDDQEPDAQIAREKRNNEPVAKIGRNLALAPPWAAGIARPEEGQNRECGTERDRYRDELHESRADAVNDGQKLLEHDSTNPVTHEAHPLISKGVLKCRESWMGSRFR